MSNEKPPLWEAMSEAYCEATESSIRDYETVSTETAAEIRAVRDWLVPEEKEPPSHLPDGDVSPQWDHWAERRRLRALLTAEADRAERGE